MNFYELTNEGGRIVLISNSSSIHKNKGNDAWKDLVLEIIKKYLGEKRKAGKGRAVSRCHNKAIEIKPAML